MRRMDCGGIRKVCGSGQKRGGVEVGGCLGRKREISGVKHRKVKDWKLT